MTLTPEEEVGYAFERAFDDMSDKGLDEIIKAFNSNAIRNPAKVINILHSLALSEYGYRNQSQQ